MHMPSWVEVVLKLGVPGAIAVFLVWRLAAGFDVFAVRMTALEQGHAEQNVHTVLAAADQWRDLRVLVDTFGSKQASTLS